MNYLSNKLQSTKLALFALLVAFMTSPGMAIAGGGGGGDFDGAEIISKVVTYTAVGVGILSAFALGRWTLRALGLIGGK